MANDTGKICVTRKVDGKCIPNVGRKPLKGSDQLRLRRTIIMNFWEGGCEGVDRIECQALVNTVMNLRAINPGIRSFPYCIKLFCCKLAPE